MTKTTTTLVCDEADTVLGYRGDGRPILLHRGGDWAGMTVEPDEGPDADDAEEADEADEDGDGSADGGYTPPSREEWERTRDAVRRNNAENKNLRLLKKQLTAKGFDLSTDEGRQALDDLVNGRAPTGSDGGTGQPSKAEVTRAVERATAKVESQLRPALAKTAAKAALADAGWSGKNLDRVMKMIDLDDFEVDAEGNITGISEQVAEIKADIPEWFRGVGAGGAKPPAGERRNGVSDVDGGDRRTKPGSATKTWYEQVDDQMTGVTR